MKTRNKLPGAGCRVPVEWRAARAFSVSITARKMPVAGCRGFTLIELLTVIAIIGIIAGMVFTISGAAKITQYRSTARAELKATEMALDSYYAQYHVYPPGNALPPNSFPGAGTNSMYNQLYYELSGVTNTGNAFVALDGAAQLSPASQVKTAFGVDGFVNCSRSGDEEAIKAKNFLVGLKANRVATIVSGGVAISNLVTSVHGPDPGYQPLGPSYPGINPIRYVYPGVHNPNSYDLWIQLKISGKTNLICNWSTQMQVNTADP